eukprot:1179029-Prorocentrum_minimum.AAC.6
MSIFNPPTFSSPRGRKAMPVRESAYGANTLWRRCIRRNGHTLVDVGDFDRARFVWRHIEYFFFTNKFRYCSGFVLRLVTPPSEYQTPLATPGALPLGILNITVVGNRCNEKNMYPFYVLYTMIRGL